GDEATNHFFGAVIRQFSQLGLLATGAVAITGLFAAYKQLPDLALLTDTDFGRTLLVKVGIFALALAAAALHRLVLKPAISRARGTSANHIRRVFSRTLLLEAALALAVLAAAAVLTSTPSRPASVASGNATQHAATLAEANAEPRGASASIPIASIPVLATSTAPQAAPGGIPAVAPRSSRQ
ncbi:MAG: CopD family protein, partial [Chloroflexota bacterium]